MPIAEIERRIEAGEDIQLLPDGRVQIPVSEDERYPYIAGLAKGGAEPLPESELMRVEVIAFRRIATELSASIEALTESVDRLTIAAEKLAKPPLKKMVVGSDMKFPKVPGGYIRGRSEISAWQLLPGRVPVRPLRLRRT